MKQSVLKGVYVLLIKLSRDERMHVGSLGEISFKKGTYAYVGSAQNGIMQRVSRHLSANKKLFWHIDYFLKEKQVKIKRVWKTTQKECRVATFLSRYAETVERFGSSDCKCRGHLFYVNSQNLFSFLKRIKADEIQI